jgi:hypothetical protein
MAPDGNMKNKVSNAVALKITQEPPLPSGGED